MMKEPSPLSTPSVFRASMPPSRSSSTIRSIVPCTLSSWNGSISIRGMRRLAASRASLPKYSVNAPRSSE